MTETAPVPLPVLRDCRWRGAQLDTGHYRCSSPKIIVGPAGIPPAACAKCPLCDHEPPEERIAPLPALGPPGGAGANLHVMERMGWDCANRGPAVRNLGVGCSSCVVYKCKEFGECTLGEHLDRGAVPRCSRECKGYTPAAAASWPRHFDELNLAPGMPGSRFNLALLPTETGYLLAWRNATSGSDVFVTRADKFLRPAGEAVRLNLHHPAATFSREDPRLFYHRGAVHVSYVGVVGPHGPTNVLYARLGEDLAVEQIYCPQYAGRNKWEKNWSFFSHDDELYAVYSIAPHRVLAIDGDKAELAHETPTRGPWSGGEARGGATPVRVGDEYVSFFHARSHHDGHLAYEMGAYTFAAEPPFYFQRMTPRPILVADRKTKPAAVPYPVVFPCGAVLLGEDWIVSMGVHDRWSELHRFAAVDVDAQLLRGAPPPWWRWRGEPQESGMYAAIHAHDEYHLAGVDVAGKVVIDAGAHVGTFAHRVSELGATVVHCYEPDQLSADLCAANGADVKGCVWTVYRQAIGARDGRGRVVRISPESTSNLVEADPHGPVRVIGLAQAIARGRAAGELVLVKLDIEGAEWEALPAADLTMVPHLRGEYHRGDPARLRRILEAQGFHRIVIDPPDPHGTGRFQADRL